ncbi:hypothetical protein LAZ67_X001712, partial [Cordylochernes scorpioides]
MVIGLKRAGWSIRQIAADTHLGASTVHRLWRRWLEQGNVAIYRNVGATRVTSARVDGRILRQEVAAPQATCTAILQHVQDTLDHSISTRTISRRLVANGLHSCRPLRRLPLTPPNRRQRLEWCRGRSTWMTEWHRVVFSDESRFCLSSDSRRVRVWRRRGERSNPAAIVERPTVRQRGIMGVPNALYQQDNARPHTAGISQQALQDVQMLPWPPYSPDLSPIEHVWDIIGRRLHALPQPRSEDELWQMVEREWRAIPQDAIRTLIDSLPRRVAACIAVRADTHLGASTVHRLWRRWLEQGNVAIYRNVGATRVTSARVDRRILRQAVAAPQATCTAILQHVQDTLDHSISTRTISRRLVANGLHSCRPLRRLPLTPPNRRQRLEWCRARSTWMTEWHRVVFSDESRFCLSSDSRRVRVWRRRGERSNPAAIVERPTVRQRGIMVWGAIAYDSRSPLLRIQGTMTAQRYVDDVLRPVTLPYLQGVPNALYQQDNTRPHTARISQQALQDVQMLPWPPYSPDLSPIEHVWDIIGRRLHALPQPRSEDELWQMVEREWRAIPHDAIRTLIVSLPRRVAACIAVGTINDLERYGRPRVQRTQGAIKAIRERIRRNPRRKQKILAKQMNLAPRTVSKIMNEDLGLRAFKRRTGHLITSVLRDIRRVRSKMLLARHDGWLHERILFTDEKIFIVEEKLNHQNDRIYARSSLEASFKFRRLEKSHHPSSVIVWWGVSYQGVIDLHFCAKGVKTTAKNYQEDILEQIVKPLNTKMFNGEHWIFQPDSSPTHKAKSTQQ